MLDLNTITDALVAAQKRKAMPTNLGTAELRELGAGILSRSVFAARGINVIFVNELKKTLDLMAEGKLSEGQVRTAIWEILDALGYDAERGGFPGEELEPAIQGSIQDLKSFRRRDLIVRTQRDLMRGAGQKMRGSEPDRLSTFPAWELVRVMSVRVPRNWDGNQPSKIDPRPRWTIAGGKITQDGRMIALKGDPVWGELGSYGNFSDALGVDHPPFAFNSGMGWSELSAAEVRELGITGPDGETPEDFLASQPVTLSGPQQLPAAQVSLNGVSPDLIKKFKEATKATEAPGKPGTYTLLERLRADLDASGRADLERAAADYQKGATR